MKTLRSLLMALALMMLMAFPALAQSGTVTVSLDCYSEPEGLTVENGLDVPLTVTGITSLEDNDGDPERELNVEVAAGETATIPIGDESASGSDNIFDNERDESAYVYITVDGETYTPQPKCTGEGSFTLGDGQDGKTPDNQQGGETVTKTFELTLKGDVPADHVFAVKYGQQQEGDTRILVFCGEMEELADFPGYEAQDECVGDGTVYTESVELAQGSVLYSTFTRYSGAGEENFFTSNDGETLDTDMTNSAWYDFGGQDDDQQDDQDDDQQGEMPEALPETGVGGLAANATIPVGGLFAAYTVLIGAGYVGLRGR